MSESAPDSPSTPAPAQEGSYSFFQMFFVPMLIAAVLTGVILFFGLIGRDTKDVSTYLEEIRVGSEHQRWQSAFELAEQLQKRPADQPVPEEDQKRALEIFDAAEGRDPRIRPYLALALGQMKARAAVPSLCKALDEAPPPPERAAEDTRVYALMSLGAIGDPSSAPAVVKALRSEDSGLRKTAAYALGGIGGDVAKGELIKALDDPVADVKWNSALSLARLGDASGKELLLVMADRAAVSATPGITEAQVGAVLEGAAKALGALRVAEAAPILTRLAQTDPDYRVREAASAGLEHLAPR